MTWVNSQLTLDDAIARGQDVWELLLVNWGDTVGPNTDGTNFMFPAVGERALAAPAAMAIGPRSTVDRCWVVYDLEKFIPSNSLWDYTRRLSVGSPLSYAQPADQGIVTNSKNRPASVMVLPWNGAQTLPGTAGANFTFDQLFYTDKYQRADGTLSTFGIGAQTPAPPGQLAAEGLWTPPLLHLIFYLRPPNLGPPAKRFPLMVRNPCRQVTAGGTGADVLLAQVPVFGRKTIVCQFMGQDRNVAPAAIPVRLALIQPIQIGNTAGAGYSPISAPQETTVFTGSVPAASATNLSAPLRAVVTPAFGDYLMIYAQWPHIGTDSDLTINVYATDD